ncbi:MAG: MFS transporter [Aquiluna sp.]|nr:MFS transporter [Aquiluna sp.]
MTRLPGARLRKAQLATLATFVVMGHAALASVAWVPEYIARLDVSFAVWGTIIGFGVIGSITPLLFASRLIMRFGSRAIIRFANYGGMIFLVTLAASSDPLVWFFLNASFGFFMSLMGVAVNSHAVMLQKQISINIMGRMHAGWSVGAVGAAITGGLSTVFLSLEVFLVIVAIATLIVFEFNLRWLLSPTEDGHLEEKASSVKRKFYQMPAELWLLGVGLFCGVYPEVAVIDWATVFAKDVLNVDVALRSIPFAAFMVGMIIGRLSMTKLAEWFHPHTLASRGAFLAAGSLAVAALLSVPVAGVSSQLGLLVTAIFWGFAGLGLAPVSPSFYSAAGHIPGVSTAWAISRLSLFNAVVSISAKTMMGALSEGVGLSLAFFFPITLAIGAGLIAGSFAKRARRSELDAAAPATGPISIIITEEGDR